MNITNFAHGLVANAAYSRFADVAARRLRNVRADGDGELVSRKGIQRITREATPITHIFINDNVLLIVQGGELKWARPPDSDDVGFGITSFTPSRGVLQLGEGAEHRIGFQPIPEGTSEAIAVSPGILVSKDTDGNPIAKSFYIQKAEKPNISWAQESRADRRGDIGIRIQAVQLNGGLTTAVGEPSDVFIVSNVTTHLDNEVDIDDLTATDITITLRDLIVPGFERDIDAFDIYRSRRDETGATKPYYFVDRIHFNDRATPYTVTIPVTDGSIEEGDELPEHGERISIDIMESDSYRLYAAESGSSRLHMTYFDGISTRHRNFVDHIDLDLGGGEITALKFIRDNVLVVYSSHRIVLLLTDPLAELHRVSSVLATATEKDSAIGCIAPHTIVDIRGWHYFLATDKRVYRFGGRTPTWVSHKIQPVLEGLAFPPEGYLSNVVSWAHEGSYFMSYPTSLAETQAYTLWRGHRLLWRGQPLKFGDPVFTDIEHHDHVLVYDVERDRWWEDDLGGVQSVVKGARERVYGVIGGQIYALYEGDDDNGTPIRWFWESNRIRLPNPTFIHNVQVNSQSAVLDVRVRMEEGEQWRHLDITDGYKYFEQRAGVNLRGRTLEIRVQGASPATIDRISFNERLRRR